jgi:16S rRNA (uracil1498-N3)-methyltransferase
MHRFYLADDQFVLSTGQLFALPTVLAHQLRDVLHLKTGETFALFNASGEEYLAVLTSSSRANVIVEVGDRVHSNREPVTNVTLCQGMLKSARFEFILEKGTELGISSFMPMLCQRSTAGLEEVGAAKLQRWQRIIQEATEQCGRTRVPTLLPVHTLSQALQQLPTNTLSLMPWEEEHTRTLRDVLRSNSPQMPIGRSVVLFIGPEGGLTSEEAAQAKSSGAQVVSLGKRILRAETAALATIADVLYELEP